MTNIGGRLCRIKMGYKKRQKEGNSRWTPLTEEQLNKIQGMGIKIEGEKSNIVDEFIEKIEKLQEIGVEVSKIVRSDTILKLVGKTLEEPEEVLIKKIKEIGLETDDNIGLKLSGIKVAYNKSQRGEKKHGPDWGHSKLVYEPNGCCKDDPYLDCSGAYSPC